MVEKSADMCPPISVDLDSLKNFAANGQKFFALQKIFSKT